MRINNLKIGSFGKLSGVNIALDDGITVIEGKNEAGKSTVSNFIKYMLYGFDSSKKQSLADNQKKKHMPWNGDECFGEMDLTCCDGREYRVLRKTGKKTETVVFDKDDMPVINDGVGEYFLGVSESAYKKTAFIGSSAAAFSDDGELSMAIRNIVYNADETLDSQKAIKKLEDIRKYYLGKAERSGRIYELEKELNELCSERDKWKDGHKELLLSEHQLKQTSSRIEDNKRQLQNLMLEKENLEYKKAKIRLDSIYAAKRKMEDGKKEFEEHFRLMQNESFVPDEQYLSDIKKTVLSICEAEKEISEAKDALDKANNNLENAFSDKKRTRVFETLSCNNEKADDLLCTVQSKLNSMNKAKKIAIVLTCLVITLPVAIFFYISSSKLSKQLYNTALEYGCDGIDELVKILCSAQGFMEVENAARDFQRQAETTLRNKMKSLDILKSHLTELLYKADIDVNNVDEYVYELEAWLKKTDELKHKCRDDFVTYSALCENADMEQLKASAEKYDESKQLHDEKTLTQKISFYTQAIDALVPKERELEKKAAVLSGTLPRPAEMQSKILSIGENLDEMKQKHKAIVLAIETLERASEGMKIEAAPKIAAETSRLFSSVTSGKYSGLYADGEMNLTFLENSDTAVRDAGYLSTGTLDAAYISLRLALCTFLYKEKPTLVFDDAFCHMDNTRLENTLDFVKELSRDFQVIILSCHDRESRYLKGQAKIIDFNM